MQTYVCVDMVEVPPGRPLGLLQLELVHSMQWGLLITGYR